MLRSRISVLRTIELVRVSQAFINEELYTSWRRRRDKGEDNVELKHFTVKLVVGLFVRALSQKGLKVRITHTHKKRGHKT